MSMTMYVYNVIDITSNNNLSIDFIRVNIKPVSCSAIDNAMQSSVLDGPLPSYYDIYIVDKGSGSAYGREERTSEDKTYMHLLLPVIPLSSD